MNRVVIVGSAGSGKSYLSKRIAEITGHPLIHLDNEFWQPNWVATPKGQWIEKQKQLVASDHWIIDGNYYSTMEIRFKAADVIILQDTNRFLCMYRAWRRHGRKRSDLPDYLDEQLDWEFVQFLTFIWKFKKLEKPRILELHHKYPEKRFIVIRNRKEQQAWLSQLQATLG